VRGRVEAKLRRPIAVRGQDEVSDDTVSDHHDAEDVRRTLGNAMRRPRRSDVTDIHTTQTTKFNITHQQNR